MTDSSAAQQPRWDNAHYHFLTHLRHMPAWHKAVVLIGGMLVIFGTVGQMVAGTGGDASVHVTTGRAPTPSYGNNVVDDTRTNTADSPQPVGSLSKMSPQSTRIGLSIVLGFIIGWLFRAFLKSMAFLAILVGGGIWLLTHFNIWHLGDADIDAIREKSGDAAHWLGAQGAHLKDLAISQLPSSGGGALGAFLGLRRR